MTTDDLFRVIAGSVPALISYIDADYRYRWANRQYESWLHQRPDEIVGRLVPDVLGDAALATVRPYMKRGLAGEELTYEAELPYRGGGPRWVRVTYVPDRGDDGTVRGIVVLVNEIAEQKQAERRIAALTDALRARVEELQMLLEVLPVGVFIGRDPACRDMSMNAVGAAMLGVPPETNPSKTSAGADRLGFRVERGGAEVPPAELPMQRAARDAVRIDGEDLEIVRPDGSRVHLWAFVSPLYDADGRVRSSLGAFVDVTERMRTQKALNDAQERFRVAQELSFDGFSILRAVRDADGTIADFVCEYVNEAGTRLLGRTREELEGRLILGVLPGLRGGLFERFVAVADGGAPHDDEIDYDSDGIRGWFRNMAVRLQDGVAVSFADITARKQLEAALRSHVDELHHEHRRKDEFLAMLAHELRNPLAPIQNVTALLARHQPRDPTLVRLGGILERQLGQLTRLVDALLDVSRIDRGRIQLQRVPTNLADVVAVAVETVRPLVDGLAHELIVSLPAGPLWVDGDPVRLAQVVSNLLNNAAKYTERGGHLALAVTRHAGHAVIQVGDDGIGIAPESLTSIFDMFAQVDRGGNRAPGGLGIGLTLVRRLVELHGGSVEAHSEGPGRGSEFTVRLPLALGAGEGLSPNGTAAAGDEALRLLVVDDNVDGGETLGILLRELGHHVCVVFDGRAALADAEAHRHDVVFLDLGMSGMDGYAVARALRARADAAGGLLVAVTGWGEAEARRRSTEAGFDRHLAKPVDVAALEEVLAVAASRGRPA